MDPTRTTATATRVYVEIGTTLDGLEANIHVQGARTGERRLEDVGPGCDSLAEAVALTLALVAKRFERDGLTSAMSVGTSDVLEPLDTERDSAGATRDARPVEVSAPSFYAGAGAAFEMLDGVGAVLFADGDVFVGDTISIGLGALYATPEDVGLGEGRLTMSLFGGLLRACATPLGARETLHLSVCAQGMAGWIFGEGSGYPQSRSPTLTWTAIGGGVLGGGPIFGSLHWSARAIVYGVPGALEFRAAPGDAPFEISRAGAFAGGGLRVVL